MAEDNEGRAPSTRGVFATALRNRSLVLVELSWLTFNGAEWGVWLALMVWAYTSGGAAAVSIIIIVQLVPCILVSPGHLHGGPAQAVRARRWSSQLRMWLELGGERH